jgi:hypothetical protein
MDPRMQYLNQQRVQQQHMQQIQQQYILQQQKSQQMSQQQMSQQQMSQQQMQQKQMPQQQMQQQQRPQRRNLLFYSERCNTSRNLIEMMKREDLLKYFEMVCIDNKLDKIPPMITHVPALITTDTPRPWMGADAFKWLQNIKYMRQQQIQDKNNKLQLYNTIKELESGGPKAFTDEMQGISDNFAYKDIDNAQPKSFEEYGKEVSKENIIYTPPIDKKKITKGEQMKLINEFKSDRSVQDKELDKVLKMKQIDEIIKTENEKLIAAKTAGLI